MTHEKTIPKETYSDWGLGRQHLLLTEFFLGWDSNGLMDFEVGTLSTWNGRVFCWHKISLFTLGFPTWRSNSSRWLAIQWRRQISMHWYMMLNLCQRDHTDAEVAGLKPQQQCFIFRKRQHLTRFQWHQDDSAGFHVWTSCEVPADWPYFGAVDFEDVTVRQGSCVSHV